MTRYTEELEYTFEELLLPGFGAGLMCYGTALLEGDDADEFVVTSITFQGGKTISRVREGTTLDARLFKEIADQIQNDKHAQASWADHMTAMGYVTQGYTQASHGTLNSVQQFGRL